MDARQLSLRTDAGGLEITDIDSIGGLNRVTVKSSLGDTSIDFECPVAMDSDIDVGTWVQVLPKTGSVFATQTSSD